MLISTKGISNRKCLSMDPKIINNGLQNELSITRMETDILEYIYKIKYVIMDRDYEKYY